MATCTDLGRRGVKIEMAVITPIVPANPVLVGMVAKNDKLASDIPSDPMKSCLRS